MKSIREVYVTGLGPSSSHTMGPRRAALAFRGRVPHSAKIRVTLYGSLAATGKGHFTDRAISDAFGSIPVQILWKPEVLLPYHPNALTFAALDADNRLLAEQTVYSVGGGSIVEEGRAETAPEVYQLGSMAEILALLDQTGQTFWEYVFENESPALTDYLGDAWRVMQRAIQRGLENEGVLQGGLFLPRKAASFFAKSKNSSGLIKHTNKIFAYALAVAEENAAGSEICTAPTCGSCGVLPSVLYHLMQTYGISEQKIIKALATAGLIGTLVKTNGSVSGAEVGCQGEIGTACSMASAAATQLLGGTPGQIEYAAEMGMEHHLGLTCDPVAGLVQIPCIERNAMAGARAIDCATYALLSDGSHRISFDDVIKTMTQTGHDMMSSYRETSTGGLARFHALRNGK
ncbi:L-serine ammonia-lyase [bacterium]|nr:L-serine ammonia-lyase [bacterium]